VCCYKVVLEEGNERIVILSFNLTKSMPIEINSNDYLKLPCLISPTSFSII